MISDTKVVAIGGGTGLSTMLKGLKLHTHNITAVVTVADDGGSSGILRSDLGMLAPGDVRNCVSALAEVDPVMGELLNFRFKDGSLKGHSLGNLFLAVRLGQIIFRFFTLSIRIGQVFVRRILLAVCFA